MLAEAAPHWAVIDHVCEPEARACKLLLITVCDVPAAVQYVKVDETPYIPALLVSHVSNCQGAPLNAGNVAEKLQMDDAPPLTFHVSVALARHERVPARFILFEEVLFVLVHVREPFPAPYSEVSTMLFASVTPAVPMK